MNGHIGFDQGFQSVIVFRRPWSTLEAQRLHHFPFAFSLNLRDLATKIFNR